MFGRYLRMSLFHVRQFFAVPYFVELLLVATIATGIAQRLAINAWGGDPYQGFLRTGFIGMWTVLTAAGGIIKFERFKGTLSYFFTSRIGTLGPLLTLISSVATAGVGAFLISSVLWCIPGPGELEAHLLVANALPLIVGIMVSWMGTLGVALIVAGLFVRSPNASAYEALLLLPLFLLSGIFTIAHDGLRAVLLIFSPTMRTVDFLMSPSAAPSDMASSLILGALSASLWVVGGLFLLGNFIRRARRNDISGFSA